MKPNPFCFLLSALCLVTATATAADVAAVIGEGTVELKGNVGQQPIGGVRGLAETFHAAFEGRADRACELHLARRSERDPGRIRGY
jgi:hypothetical protein